MSENGNFLLTCSVFCLEILIVDVKYSIKYIFFTNKLVRRSIFNFPWNN